MRTGRHNANVPVALAAGVVVPSNGHETRILPRSARVGLQAHAIETCDFTELLRQGIEHLGVALGLRGVSEGVHVRELWPRDGHHLRRAVELHGAGAEGDHGVAQRQVTVFQVLQVPEKVSSLVSVRVRHMGS